MTIADAAYVLPLRWDRYDAAAVDELAGYVRDLADALPVIVVDGSPPGVFERHAEAWADHVRHVRPRPSRLANKKVAAVLTGLDATDASRVILADDDVRHTRTTIARLLELLDGADLVRPQNYFDPVPWHARWDTGRMLVNRAVVHDYPGTYAVRAERLRDDGYDGDVLFENLEMERTIAARGGRVRDAPDVVVARRPPAVTRFFEQRVRQAYDGFAQPPRLVAELLLAPLGLRLLRSPVRLGVAMLGVAALAEYGRRRSGGRAVFPADTSLWAVLWVIERALCAWLAVAARARGGVRYRGVRVRRAAHSLGALRAAFGGR